MMDWSTVSKELAKKLDPANVKPPAPGKYGEYIEGFHAINEANRIFGFGGWSYTLDGLQLTNEEHQNDGKHRVGYLARVTVTVDGVSRGDVGHGQGFGKSLGDAHDSAVKEAVTDALKRSLRTFGNPFGLALYDKTKANVGVDIDVVSEIDRIKGELSAATTDVDLRKAWQANQDALRALGSADEQALTYIREHLDQCKAALVTRDNPGMAAE